MSWGQVASPCTLTSCKGHPLPPVHQKSPVPSALPSQDQSHRVWLVWLELMSAVVMYLPGYRTLLLSGSVKLSYVELNMLPHVKTPI